MQNFQTAAPDRRLAPFVRCFAQRERVSGSPPAFQANTGVLANVLDFNFCDLTIINSPAGVVNLRPPIALLGPQTRFGGFSCLRGHTLSFAIFFRPFALWQLFGIPTAELVDLDCEGAAVLGSWVAELWHKLGCSRTFSERVVVASETILNFIQSVRPLTSIMCTVHRLLPSDKRALIGSVAQDSAMSRRSYERQFAREIGISPKWFARLARFGKAIDLRRMNKASWVNISHDLGYSDQMHMIRDFRIFGGDTPGRLVLADSDFNPWSIGNALRGSQKLVKENAMRGYEHQNP
jgi:AraC-like DNA-binding protein